MNLSNLIILFILYFGIINIIICKKEKKEDEFTEYINWCGYNKIYRHSSLNFTKEVKGTKTLYKLFSETAVIGLTPELLGSKVASFGVPEFGTRFVQGMLMETTPKTFAQLVKISGLSHGTNVWANNSQELVNGRTPFGPIEFKNTKA